MARVLVDGDKLQILMGTVESYQTRTRRYEVPLSSIIGVNTDRAPTTFAGSFSTGGGFGFGVAYKPGSFGPIGGRFSTKEGKLLVAFRDPEKCISVSLKDQQYDRVIVQVNDKDQVAEQVRKAISSLGGSLGMAQNE